MDLVLHAVRRHRGQPAEADELLLATQGNALATRAPKVRERRAVLERAGEERGRKTWLRDRVDRRRTVA